MPEQLSDSILLERFVSGHEEAAFVALVARHGPLVRQVCAGFSATSKMSRMFFRPRFSSWRGKRR